MKDLKKEIRCEKCGMELFYYPGIEENCFYCDKCKKWQTK